MWPIFSPYLLPLSSPPMPSFHPHRRIVAAPSIRPENAMSFSFWRRFFDFRVVLVFEFDVRADLHCQVDVAVTGQRLCELGATPERESLEINVCRVSWKSAYPLAHWGTGW